MEKPTPNNPIREPTDRELVLSLQNGDLGAFDQLVKRYQARLYRVIYGVLLHHEDTNDVLMETLVKAYRNIGRFRIGASFYTWIYRIAINAAISYRRKTARFRQAGGAGSQADDEEKMPEAFVDEPAGKEALRKMELQELHQEIERALSQLSEAHRAVVTLFDIEGLSHAEIAKIVGCSEGTVRSRLFYAHKRLRESLRNYV
ncbi:DNA-directed RNA polymerase specialized sigma subunit [Methylacidimicrobium sp. AP8]|uniref:RNA polymerase sigma factor n=1 Tax=Methylacidimicrobium sp. AP8 TaxID=2730359 RepID=UPI0018C14D69|nr:sigma-70 family RNA polymerase sigma factor [Methylacidimicrobium sp. AP8]CAB4242701.1 DNA-directed RNA polymerase specialized sigma subunit [Methylacidimicrobium sp. AP8]